MADSSPGGPSPHVDPETKRYGAPEQYEADVTPWFSSPHVDDEAELAIRRAFVAAERYDHVRDALSGDGDPAMVLSIARKRLGDIGPVYDGEHKAREALDRLEAHLASCRASVVSEIVAFVKGLPERDEAGYRHTNNDIALLVESEFGR